MHAQEFPSSKELNEIGDRYSEELNLSKDTSKKFNKLLFYYNNKLVAIDSVDKLYSIEVNKIVKLFDLEIYKLLSEKEFDRYKKVKISIEPYKKYRL
jgi:hypothetical protein